MATNEMHIAMCAGYLQLPYGPQRERVQIHHHLAAAADSVKISPITAARCDERERAPRVFRVQAPARVAQRALLAQRQGRPAAPAVADTAMRSPIATDRPRRRGCGGRASGGAPRQRLRAAAARPPARGERPRETPRLVKERTGQVRVGAHNDSVVIAARTVPRRRRGPNAPRAGPLPAPAPRRRGRRRCQLLAPRAVAAAAAAGRLAPAPSPAPAHARIERGQHPPRELVHRVPRRVVPAPRSRDT